MKIIYEGKPIELEGHDGFAALKAIAPERKNQVVALKKGAEIVDLMTELHEGDEISFIRIGDKESYEVLNHSTSHLMAQALKRLYPEIKFGFGPDIEEGYYYDFDLGDKTITEADFPKIEEEMKKCAKENYRYQRKEVSSEEALKIFESNPYKKELIEEHKDEGIHLYEQGEFIDLCKGPHVPSTGLIKHFKLLSVAGAYWRGDSKNKQLTRIYGTSWWTEEELKNHLETLERRKENDHRKLGRELGLFMLTDYGPGFPFFLPNGMRLKNALLEYWREVHKRYGYEEIETPTMLSRELWETSGHWDHYKENMYVAKIDERDFAIKPMNCPGSILVYKNGLHSYRELPLRYAELGHVHRHEASGALNGLFRVRAFTQDDSHIFCRQSQIEDEVKNIMRLFDEVYEVFGLSYHIVLSTRPDDYIGEKEFWDLSEKALASACESSGHEYSINPGDGAFYGPKLDFKLKDSMGRTWQCGTIQLDVNLPHRFECNYINEAGEKEEPVLLHRVVFGSVERFIGIITENYGGAFPFWLAPVQMSLLPVAESHEAYAEKFRLTLEEKGFRPEILSEEKLGYRLRDSVSRKIPYSVVLGDKEVESESVTIRRYGEKEQVTLPLSDFLKLIEESREKKTRF